MYDLQLYVMKPVRMEAAAQVLIHVPVPLDGQIQRVNQVSQLGYRVW